MPIQQTIQAGYRLVGIFLRKLGMRVWFGHESWKVRKNAG
jgi:hypothetical protein